MAVERELRHVVVTAVLVLLMVMNVTSLFTSSTSFPFRVTEQRTCRAIFPIIPTTAIHQRPVMHARKPIANTGLLLLLLQLQVNTRQRVMHVSNPSSSTSTSDGRRMRHLRVRKRGRARTRKRR